MSYKILYVLIFLTVSTNAHAEIIASGNDCGENCSWTIDDKGVLTVSGTGDMKDYSDPEEWSRTYPRPWQSYNNTVKEIVIGEGITSVGTWAFKDFKALETLTLADSVKKIGMIAFDSATSLNKINMSENSQLESINWQAFSHDKALTSFVVPSAATNVGSAAFHDTDTIVVYCPESNTSCKANIGGSGLTIIRFTQEDGIYKIGEGEDAKYYASTEAMVLGEDCGSKCAQAKALSESGEPFVIDGKFYASLSDYVKRNYIKKRIYTVDEAEMLSKPTGNTFRMRYK